MRISDWSSDVCSSDLCNTPRLFAAERSLVAVTLDLAVEQDRVLLVVLLAIKIGTLGDQIVVVIVVVGVADRRARGVGLGGAVETGTGKIGRESGRDRVCQTG